MTRKPKVHLQRENVKLFDCLEANKYNKQTNK